MTDALNMNDTRNSNEIWHFTLVSGDDPKAEPLAFDFVELPDWLLRRDFDKRRANGYLLYELLLRAWVMSQTGLDELGLKHRRYYRRNYPTAMKTEDKALIGLRWANGPREYKHRDPPLRAEDGSAWRVARGLFIGTYGGIRKHENGIPAKAFDALPIGRVLDMGAKRTLHWQGVFL